MVSWLNIATVELNIVENIGVKGWGCLMVKVSLIASSVRHELYEDFFRSLEGTSIEYEVIFAGNNPPINDYGSKYIETANIKPAQCYEIARRHAKGEVIVWCADDCEFNNDVIGKAYKYWKAQNNKKHIISLQTREYYLERPDDKGSGFCDMYCHTFTGKRGDQLMAPLTMINREYVEELGGIDRRYICGQWDNSIVMDAYIDGATVEVFGDKDCHVEIDHVGKFEKVTGKKGFSEHRKRPFGTGFKHDRGILETTWGKHGMLRRRDKHEPFSSKNILIESQSYKGIWE